MLNKGKEWFLKAKEAKHSIALKSEKGSITVFVLAAMLLLVTVLFLSYAGISNKVTTTGKQVNRIQEEYATESAENGNKIDQEYDKVVDNLDRQAYIKLFKPSGEEYTVDQWTNQDLSLRIYWTYKNDGDKYFYLDGQKIKYQENYKITDNCTISVETGKKETELKVTRIDKVKPEISLSVDGGVFVIPTNSQTSTLRITVTGKDDKSGIEKLQYAWSDTGTTEPTTYQDIESGKTIEKTDAKAGNNYLWTKATDKAGNVTTKVSTYTVLSKDESQDQIILTASPSENVWTNKDVTVTAKYGVTLVNNQKMTCTGISATDYVINNARSAVVKTNNKTVTAEAEDKFGNKITKQLTLNKIDKKVPTLTITPNGGTAYVMPSTGKATLKTTVVAKDEGGSNLETLEYAWSTSNTTEPTTGFTKFENGKEITKTDAQVGNYYLWVKVLDAAGNRAETKVSNVFTIGENTLEDNKIALVPSTTDWTNKDVTVTVTYGKNLSKNRKAGMGSTLTASATTITATENGIAHAEATDIAGNKVVAELKIDNIDKVAPKKPTYVARYADNKSYTSGTWTNRKVYTDITAEDGLSGIKSIQYSADKLNWTTFGFTASNGMKENGLKATGTEEWGLSNRNDTRYFRTIDKAGNVSEVSDAFTIKYDITKPTVTMNPNGGTAYTMPTTGNATIKATLTASDAGGSGLSTIQYAWATSNTTEPTTWTNFTSGSTVSKTDCTAGTYYLWTKVTDAAGNRAETGKVSNAFTVGANTVADNKITISKNPTGWTNGNVTATVTYGKNITANKKAGVGSANTANATTVTVTANGTVYAEGTDSAGNKATASLQVSNIDKTAPQITAISNSSNGNWVNADVTVTLTGSDVGSGIKEFQWYENGAWTTRALTTSGNTATITYTVDRNETIRFRVIDKVGNVSAEKTAVVKIDKIVPAINAYAGTMLYTDPSFASGTNGTHVYNNSGNGTVTNTRVASSDNPAGSGYALEIKTTGSASPGHGGFYFATGTAANKEYITRIVAKIPKGYNINWASNAYGSTGASSQWLTSQAGTGAWQEYVYRVKCGSDGSFSSTNFYYVSGGSTATTAAPVTWQVGYATVIDTTKWGNVNYVVASGTDSATGVAAYGINQSSTTQPTWTTFTANNNVGKISSKLTANGTYYVWLKDGAGNVSKKEVAVSKVDATAPTVSFGTNGGTLTITPGSATATISSKVTASDTGGSSLSTVHYQITTSATSPSASNGSWTSISNGGTVSVAKSGGTYYLHVKAVDGAGNTTITKTAAFTVNYKVVFNANGGTGAPGAQIKTHGTNLTLSSTKPTWTGHTFLGWGTSADATTATYSAGGTYSTNAATNLYAVWKTHQYTVEYNGNGATSGSTASSSHTYGVAKALTTNGFVRKGYTFKGWATTNTGSVAYTDKQSVTNLSNQDGAKVILYAVWQINTYTVTYNYTENSGSSATKTSASVNYGSTIDLTPTATKSGYNFVGWNTNKNGTSKLSSLTMDAGNVTLYAIYSKTITATCYYYSRTAQTSKTVSNTIYNKTTGTTLSLGTISLTGYTFRGWSTSNSGNATISVGSNGSVNLSSDATYYACYSYAVTGTYKYYNGTAYTSSTVTATAYMNSSGTKIGGRPTAPTVSNPSGWTARGWGLTTSSTGTVIIPAAITTNTTYYYSWSKTITLYYNLNGGSGSNSSQTGTNYLNYAGSQTGTQIAIKSAKPIKAGYAFLKWSRNSSGTNGEYLPESTYKFTESTTLYAVFGKITFNANGGSVVRPKDGTVDLSSKVTLEGATANLEYAWSTSNTTAPEAWTEMSNGATVTNSKCTANNYYLWVRILNSSKSKTLMQTKSLAFKVFDVRLETSEAKLEYKENEEVSYDGIKIVFYNLQGDDHYEGGKNYITNYAKNDENTENIRYTYTVKYNDDYSWDITTYKDEWYGTAFYDWYYYKNHEKITGEHDLVFKNQLDTYYFDETGLMFTGWRKMSDGKWYYYFEFSGRNDPNVAVCIYLDPNRADLERGFKLKSVWGYIKSKATDGTGYWYYFDENGILQTGWVKVDGKTYYCNSSGAMQTEWQQIDGSWYYFNEKGVMQTGWQKIGNSEYYFNEKGIMQTGWQQVDDYWYYFNEKGVIQTGWQQISGSWYYLKVYQDGVSWSGPSGSMLCNTSATIGGKTYNFNSSGVCTNP